MMYNKFRTNYSKSPLVKPDNNKDLVQKLLDKTFWLGITVGMVAVFGYTVGLNCKFNLLFLCAILSAASFISGFFLGFLFGIPKRTTGNGNGNTTYTLNNNLIDISDWLTKIIIGLGLIEIKQIPKMLQSIGEYVSINTGCGSSITVFVVCCIVYFSVFGIYYGYNYIRLTLSSEYKRVDDELLKVMVAKVVEEANTQGALDEDEVKSIINNRVDSSQDDNNQSKFKLTSYDEFVKLKEKAKQKLSNGLKLNSSDPNKGQWGGLSENNERKITATVTAINDEESLYNIVLKVTSTNPETNPLNEGELVMFCLHNTFKNAVRIVPVSASTAKVELLSYGSFTVGVFVDEGETELELDLASLDNVSENFKNR